MRIYDSHAAYCMLSRDRRPSALTAYLPLWHGDIMQFITCRTARAAPEDRVRHVFPALWIPDILSVIPIQILHTAYCSSHSSMLKLRDNANWALFYPTDTLDLNNVFGDQFSQLYEHYLLTTTPITTVRTGDLWQTICHAQVETGSPFIMYQDNVNRKSRSPVSGARALLEASYMHASQGPSSLAAYLPPDRLGLGNNISIGVSIGIRVVSMSK